MRNEIELTMQKEHKKNESLTEPQHSSNTLGKTSDHPHNA